MDGSAGGNPAGSAGGNPAGDAGGNPAGDAGGNPAGDARGNPAGGPGGNPAGNPDGDGRAHAPRVRVERAGPVLSIELARPDVHDAFDDLMIAELTLSFAGAAVAPGVRVVVLRSTGRCFSAGADAGWMRRLGEASRAENAADARRLAGLFAAIAACPRPVVARVQGPALGGGAGLAVAADVVVAADAAVLGFPEVRLGILPAVILPHVLRRLPAGRARALLLSGERVGAERALALGLVDEVVPAAGLDAAVERAVAALLEGSPNAQARLKSLLAEVEALPPGADPAALTAAAIADARADADGREGLSAFLEKRRPSWAPPRDSPAPPRDPPAPPRDPPAPPRDPPAPPRDPSAPPRD